MNDSGVDDICKWEPWEFPAIKTYDLVWFFISLADYKYSKVLQGFCLQVKNMAEYGSVTDLLKNKNPVKKDCKVSENPSPILSSIWNELVGKISKVLQFLALGQVPHFTLYMYLSAWFSFQPIWVTNLNTSQF